MKDRILAAVTARASNWKLAIPLAFEGDPMCSCDGKPECRLYHASRPDFEFQECSWHLTDHFKDDELPAKTGLWVWEGMIVYRSYGDDDDCEPEWEGTWREATYADLRHFKVMLPLVTTHDI